MKKMMRILLVVIMILACFALAGCETREYTELEMKRAYLDQFNIKGRRATDVVIDYDAGTYNGARVVMLDAECQNEPVIEKVPLWAIYHYEDQEWTETVGESEFYYYDSNRLRVFKNGIFYTLAQARFLGILSKQDIADIEAKYSTDVTSFLDICDKYDFDECEIWLNYEPDDQHFLSDRICVRIDQRISATKESFIRYLESFLGPDIVIRVVSDDGSSLLWPGGYAYQIHIYDKGGEHLLNVIAQLSKVPGILCVACHTSRTHFGASAGNDYYYDDPENWGVKNIYADKVWDFKTGRKTFA